LRVCSAAGPARARFPPQAHPPDRPVRVPRAPARAGARSTRTRIPGRRGSRPSRAGCART